MAAPLPDSDGDLVRLALEGRQDAFSALYERYFPGVYDFLARLLRDRDEAADVTQDTFLKAMQQLSTLEQPDRFKSWVFSIAHRSGLNRIRSSRRSVPTGAGVDDDERASMAIADPDPSADPEQMVAAQEAADIVWEAAAGLDERTYAVMDLHVRQGLDSAEIAEILGVSKGNAYTMVSRMKQAFSNTLATYLLVRKGRHDCPQLAAIVGGDVEMSPGMRKRADRHVRICHVCSQNRMLYFEPVKIFAALLLVPVPVGLKAAVWGTVAATGAVGAAGAGAAVSGGAGGETAASSVWAGASSGAGTGAGGSAGLGVGAVAGSGVLGLGAGAMAVSVGLALVLAVGSWFLIASSGDGDPPLAAADAGEITALDTVAPPTTVAAPVDSTTTSTTAIPAEQPGTPVATTTTTTVPVATTPTTTTLPPVVTTTIPPALPLALADDAVSVMEDGVVEIDVLANDSGHIDAATVAVHGSPGNGSATAGAAGRITYTPDPDYSGADSFVYSASDELGTVASAVVAVTVTGVNDPPVFPDDFALVVDEDATVSFDPLALAADPDGDVLEIVTYDGVSEAGGVIVEGSLVYTPPADFHGVDRFTFTLGDGTTTVVVTVYVEVTSVPDPPQPPIGTIVLSTDEDTAVTGQLLAGWQDPDGDPIGAVPGPVSTSGGGTAVIQAGGVVTYLPAADFNGIDTFPFRVTDGELVAEATVEVTVAPVNDTPVVADITLAVPEDTIVGTVVGTVEASDVDGDVLVFSGAEGPFEVETDGDVVVAAPLDHETEASVTMPVLVDDGNGGWATGTVVVSVEEVNEPPSLADVTLTVSTSADVGDEIGRLTGTDPDGDILTYAIVAGNAAGRFALSSDGVLSVAAVVTPLPDSVALTVEVSDGHLASTATVTVVFVDDEGPVIADFTASPLSMYTGLSVGRACPAGSSSTTVTATVTDPSGVSSVVLESVLEFGGNEFVSERALVVEEDEVTVTITVVSTEFPKLTLGWLHLSLTAVDDHGNASHSDGPIVRVRLCDPHGDEDDD